MIKPTFDPIEVMLYVSFTCFMILLLAILFTVIEFGIKYLWWKAQYYWEETFGRKVGR